MTRDTLGELKLEVSASAELLEALLDSERGEPGRGLAVPTLGHHPRQAAVRLPAPSRRFRFRFIENTHFT